jgi:hypothetical protein
MHMWSLIHMCVVPKLIFKGFYEWHNLYKTTEIDKLISSKAHMIHMEFIYLPTSNSTHLYK